jgi:hypothetical protein
LGIQGDNDDGRSESYQTQNGHELRYLRSREKGFVYHENVPLKDIPEYEWSEDFWPDGADECFTEAWLLPVAFEGYWIHCLALVEIGSGNKFRRVGFCIVDRDRSPSFFDSAYESIITLV